jgi:hypothetical protein
VTINVSRHPIQHETPHPVAALDAWQPTVGWAVEGGLTRRQLTVGQSEWKGKVTTAKENGVRQVPLTARLAGLKGIRHLRSPRGVWTERAHS